MKALNHPVRVKALKILTERTASPKEIADAIETPLSNVSYHVRVLNELGLVEIIEEENVRGAVQHFYKALERPMVSNDDWLKLDPKVRGAFSAHLIDNVLSDAARSLETGYFDKRADRQATRVPLCLDEQGWRAVHAIQAKALDQALKEQSAAAERMNGSGEGIPAILAMFLFELPPDADH